MINYRGKIYVSNSFLLFFLFVFFVFCFLFFVFCFFCFFFFCKSMSRAWFWFDIVLFLVLSSCQKRTRVGGTGRKGEKKTFIYVYMINGITTLRKQRQLLFFIVVVIIIIIIFVYLVGWGVKGKSVGLA